MSDVRSHEHVPSYRILLAALAGAVLYYVVVVLLGGVLAAVAIPRGFFAFFGHEHTELALASVNMLSWALPVLAVVFLGAFGTLSALHSTRAGALALTLGTFACFAFWQADFVWFAASQPNSAPSFGQALVSSLLPTWWEAPNILSLGRAWLSRFGRTPSVRKDPKREI